MRQPEWLMTWWDAYGPADGDLFLLLAFDGERLVGLAPLYRLNSERQLRFLGDGDVCTDYNGILCAIDQDANSLSSAFADWLMNHSSDRGFGWDSLYLEGVPSADTLTQRFHGALIERQCLAMDRNPMNTWCVDLSGGWEQYLALASRDTRKKLRRRLASLADIRVHQVQSEQDWKTYYPILIDLHQRRRIALGELGCFQDYRFTSFLEAASLRLLPLGQLQAFYLERDGKPIAADIGFRSRTHWYCYQGGIEPSAMEMEPGKMANVWMLSQAPDQGISAVDFLRGDEPYKKQLKADPQPISDLWIARPGWKGLSQKWLWQSKQILSETAREMFQLSPIPLTRF